MAKKETAEQKLLKIIEATKKTQAQASLGPATPHIKKPRFSISIHHINFLLALVVIASLLFFIKELIAGRSLVQQDVTILADQQGAKDIADPSLPKEKPLSHYLEKISSRNIFQPYEKKEQVKAVTAGTDALDLKLQKYKLVGVAWLDLPESATVMIEEKSSGVTRFLKQGDKLDDVTVKTIFTDRVVVGYENEERVIKL